MKIQYVLFSTALTVALTLPVSGQDTHHDKTKMDMKQHELSRMMGKPTVDATVEGLHLKVWLMTQNQHKKMMKGMKDPTMAMDKATKEAMMAGTHHIVLVVTNSASGKEIENADAKVLILSPTNKNSSRDLRPVMSHFGDGLTLSEKGTYRFTIIVKVEGVPKAKQFRYTVK